MRTAEQIAEALAEFKESDQLLLSKEQMASYPNRWVAAYKGRVVAADPLLIDLRNKLGEMAIPLSTVAIRFIEADGQAAE